ELLLLVGFVVRVHLVIDWHLDEAELRELGGALGLWQSVEFRQHFPKPLVAASEGARDRSERARKSALEHDASERVNELLLALHAGQELVDELSHLVVELKLRPVERERLSDGVPLGEEPLAREVLEVFLHAPQIPGVALELNDLFVALQIDELV